MEVFIIMFDQYQSTDLSGKRDALVTSIEKLSSNRITCSTILYSVLSIGIRPEYLSRIKSLNIDQ